MNTVFSLYLIPLLGYLAGSIPIGFLCSRFVTGMDIRRHGSGNIGATNIGRVLGAKWGFLVLILDLLKGLLSVVFLPRIGPQEWRTDLAVCCGFAAILGHMYPIWLNFRGGKGVATALGVVSALFPIGTLIAVTVFLFIVGATRMVSLGSVCAVISFGLTHFIKTGLGAFSPHNRSLSLFSLVIPALIIIAHRENLIRIVRGRESKLGEQKPPKHPPEDR